VSAEAPNDDSLPAAPTPAAAGLAEHVYLLLKAEVINDQFAAGTRIVIESVALRLGVSPTPVREALARLAGEQLVSFRVYVGYRDGCAGREGAGVGRSGGGGCAR